MKGILHLKSSGMGHFFFVRDFRVVDLGLETFYPVVRFLILQIRFRGGSLKLSN